MIGSIATKAFEAPGDAATACRDGMPTGAGRPVVDLLGGLDPSEVARASPLARRPSEASRARGAGR